MCVVCAVLHTYGVVYMLYSGAMYIWYYVRVVYVVLCTYGVGYMLYKGAMYIWCFVHVV